MDDDELKQYKEIEYYSSFVQAWISTKMEKDKSILTLSTAAIGLLVTLANTYEIKTTYQMVYYTIATFSFLLAIICALSIFHKNAIYLEKVMNDTKYENDPSLVFLDYSLVITFVIGVFMSILISISSITIKKENKMPNNKPPIDKNETVEPNTKGLTILNESLNNITIMQPQNNSTNQKVDIPSKSTINSSSEERSLNGIGKVKPTTTPPPKQDGDSKK